MENLVLVGVLGILFVLLVLTILMIVVMFLGLRTVNESRKLREEEFKFSKEMILTIYKDVKKTMDLFTEDYKNEADKKEKKEKENDENGIRALAIIF